MTITTLRDELQEARTHLEHGQTAAALSRIEAALKELDSGQLLTTTEAAKLLGIRSVNTLKLWLQTENVATVQRGNRTMIPVTEVERLQQSERGRRLRASDRAHDASEQLGDPRGLSKRQFVELEAARPGTLPWKSRPRGSGEAHTT